MVEYKEIKKEHGNLGEFLSTLLKKKYRYWGKYQELFNGIEYDSWAEFEGAIKELNKYLEGNKISNDIYKCDCNKVAYTNHGETIKDSMSGSGKQDVYVKHLIPITEKDEVINRLYSMNINEYSLFHTEESLLKTVAYERIR